MFRQTAIAVLAAACLAVSLSPAEAGFIKARKETRAASIHTMCPLDLVRHHLGDRARPAKKVAAVKAKPAPKKEVSLKDTKPAKPAKAAKKA